MAFKKKNISVGFIALGCPKNMVDSERMLAEIAQGGFVITAEPRNADVVVINTCAFIAPARAEAIETIKKYVRYKNSRSRKPAKVIVAGCLPEKSGSSIAGQIDGVDAFVGLGQRDNIAAIIHKTFVSEQPAFYPSDRKYKTVQTPDDRTRLLLNPPHWAYLRISEGCNHQCSFCTIPSIRGKFRSKRPALVLAEAKELVEAGVVELNIIAQDTTSYGKDLKMRDGLACLLKKLDKINSLVWIRLMYLYPTGITDKLLETIAQSRKVVHYLDVPIQHVSKEILHSMRRPGSADRLHKLIEKIRSFLPDVVLRTTLIVGYPGETESQFREMLDFVKWVQFDALGCFTFSPEHGTEAATLPEQISQQLKQQRLAELMLCQQKIAFAKNKNRIGSRITCLVDEVNKKGCAFGRYFGQSPDIDSRCIIKDNVAAPAGSSIRPGQFIEAKVVGTKDYDLIVSCEF
jgi:ribosomal protein S12 methylthiotransferase